MEFNFKTGAKEGYPGEENLTRWTTEFRAAAERRAAGRGRHTLDGRWVGS